MGSLHHFLFFHLLRILFHRHTFNTCFSICRLKSISKLLQLRQFLLALFALRHEAICLLVIFIFYCLLDLIIEVFALLLQLPNLSNHLRQRFRDSWFFFEFGCCRGLTLIGLLLLLGFSELVLDVGDFFLEAAFFFVELLEPHLNLVCTVLWPKSSLFLPTQALLQRLNQIPHINQLVLQIIVHHFSVQLLFQVLQLSLLHRVPIHLHLHLLQLLILLFQLLYILARLLNLPLQVSNLRLTPRRLLKLPHSSHFFLFQLQLLQLLCVVSDRLLLLLQRQSQKVKFVSVLFLLRVIVLQ